MLAAMLFVPLYLQAAAWHAGFAAQGWYTLATATPAWIEGWTGAIWIHSMAAVPWVVLIVGAGLRLSEPELEEQALLDGSQRQVFWHVTLRAARPAVALAALWIAILTAGEMTVTDLFAIRTYAEEVYTRIAVGQEAGDAPLGMLPGMSITAALIAAALVLASRLGPRERPLSFRRQLVFATGRWRWPLLLAVAAIVLLMIGVPLGSLIYKAGVLVTQTDAGRLRCWSPWKCLRIIAAAPWRFRREFTWSLSISALAAAADVLAALPLAWWARRGRWRAGPAIAVTAVCLAVPGPVLGLAVIWLLNTPSLPWLVHLYDHSILAPWLALALRGLPAATLVLWHALKTVPGGLLETAALDGAGPVTRMLRLVLPLRWPALLLAWLVALAVALGDLAASILVVPPGVMTLSIQVFGLLHYGVEDQVAGICLALVTFCGALAGLAAWLIRRWIVVPLDAAARK
jgi:iron(III) transport system permease protein